MAAILLGPFNNPQHAKVAALKRLVACVRDHSMCDAVAMLLEKFGYRQHLSFCFTVHAAIYMIPHFLVADQESTESNRAAEDCKPSGQRARQCQQRVKMPLHAAHRGLQLHRALER